MSIVGLINTRKMEPIKKYYLFQPRDCFSAVIPESAIF